MKTVLVLDDEPFAMRVICAVLRSLKCNVVECTRSEEAVDAARSLGAVLDLLVADVLIPGMSGVQVALEVFQACHSPILFVSGTPFDGWQSWDLVKLQALPRKMWRFMQKPFQPSLLEDHVGELLQLARYRPEASLSATAASGGDVVPQTNDGTGVAGITVDRLLPASVAGDEAMIEPKFQFGPDSFPGSHIPEIAFCPEKARLTGEFLRAIHELTDLQSQQTSAVINADADFARFDVLIHMAAERKEEAKYALIRHMESHHCEEG